MSVLRREGKYRAVILDVTTAQKKKLKMYAIENDMTMTDVVKERISDIIGIDEDDNAYCI